MSRSGCSRGCNITPGGGMTPAILPGTLREDIR
jgi:hypothetical protein